VLPPARWLPLAALLAMTAAWGSTFFLIKDVVTRLPVADLLALRFGLASVALLLLTGRRLWLNYAVLRHGMWLGGLYGIAQILQTVGLASTSASVSGFLTGLYVVATPLLAAVLLRSRISGWTWAGAALATVGLGVLSLRGFTIGYGEMLTVASAVVYAGHIVALGRWSTAANAMALALVQMVTITVVCSVAAAADGKLVLPQSGRDWGIVIYLAVVAGALAMVLQTWAQAHLEASRAAVVMATEPVWAAAFAVSLGGESITVRMLLGGAAILAAIWLVEVGPRRRARAPAPAEPSAASPRQGSPR